MKYDRKVLKQILKFLKGQVREIEGMLKKPQVMTRIYLETCIEFDDSPVPEKGIDNLVGEIESALVDAAEGVIGVQERDANVAVEISSIDREEVEEEDDDDDE